MRINAITRNAFAYMVAGAAMFFHLTDRGYFVQHANENIPLTGGVKVRNFRQHLEGMQMSVIKIFNIIGERNDN